MAHEGMARKQIERPAPLAGVWQGAGTARFPSVEAASYPKPSCFGSW